AAARVQAHAEADERANGMLLGEGDVVAQLEGLLDDDHDLAAELRGPEGRAEVVAVLEAVAGDDRIRARVERDRREELGLAARLEPEPELVSSPQQLAHDRGGLVDLDRKDGTEAPVVAELRDRAREGVAEVVDLVLEVLRVAQQQRRGDVSR